MRPLTLQASLRRRIAVNAAVISAVCFPQYTAFTAGGTGISFRREILGTLKKLPSSLTGKKEGSRSWAGQTSGFSTAALWGSKVCAVCGSVSALIRFLIQILLQEANRKMGLLLHLEFSR